VESHSAWTTPGMEEVEQRRSSCRRLQGRRR